MGEIPSPRLRKTYPIWAGRHDRHLPVLGGKTDENETLAGKTPRHRPLADGAHRVLAFTTISPAAGIAILRDLTVSLLVRPLPWGPAGGLTLGTCGDNSTFCRAHLWNDALHMGRHGSTYGSTRLRTSAGLHGRDFSQANRNTAG